MQNNIILMLSIAAAAVALFMLFLTTSTTAYQKENSLVITTQLSSLIQTNERISFQVEKIAYLRQFALKEPEQQKLQQLQSKLIVQRDSLTSTLRKESHLFSIPYLDLYADTITRLINKSEPPLNILISLSPSDFNWKEKQSLSTQQLSNILPETSQSIINFQRYLADNDNTSYQGKSFRQTIFIGILFISILIMVTFLIRPLSNKVKVLSKENITMSSNAKANRSKISELNGIVMNLEEKIIEEKNQNTIINKSLEEKNKEIKRFKEDAEYFTYIISHDLKAPLRAVNSLASWIYEDMADVLEEDQRKYLDILRSRVQRMDELINGILNFSMAGKKSEKKEKIFLNQLISELVLELNENNETTFSIQQDLPLIMTEKVALHIVLKHLLSNAIKFNSSSNPFVSVKCEQKVDFYEFAIQDNGNGIAEEYHEQIFEIFRTLEENEENSSGIGLSIAKKIIQDKGGAIWLTSSPGNGSTFYFTWPA